MSDSRRQAAVEEALRAAARALLALSASKAEVLAVVAAAMVADSEVSADTPRERMIAVRRSRRQRMADELARHEQEGRGREAPMLVARAFAADPHDPVEVESLARKLRRWRLKKNGHYPFACPKVD